MTILLGCDNTMLDLSDLVPFHSGQDTNFYLLFLGQVKINLQTYCISYLGLDATKSVIRFSDKAILKPASTAKESSWKIEISLVARLGVIISKKRITKVLISLHGYASWSVPLLSQTPRRQVFWRLGPFGNYHQLTCCVENIMDHDQLASKSFDLDLHLLLIVYVWFHTVFKGLYTVCILFSC